MKINLATLIEGTKKTIDFKIEDNIDKINYLGDEIKFISPITFDGNIKNQNGELFLQGKVEGVAELSCHRCLRKFQQKISSNVHEKLVMEKSAKDTADDFYVISNNMVDVTEILENTLILSLPMKIICDEGCKGLCPVCGTDLNIHQCNCDEDRIDPRLAKLKDLL